MGEKWYRAMLEVQDDQLTVLKKIHFWIKFWSILAIIATIVTVCVYVIPFILLMMQRTGVQ